MPDSLKNGNQIKLSRDQNIGDKKRKVLTGLALGEHGAIKNFNKFLQNTVFPSQKKIAALDQGDVEENKKSTTTRPPATTLSPSWADWDHGGGNKGKDPNDEPTILVPKEPTVTARDLSPELVKVNFIKL